MKRKLFALSLVSILGIQSGLIAGAGAFGGSAAPQTGSSQKPTLKERVLEIPLQSLVEIRLRDKEKVRGRLGEVSDTGFVLKTAHQNKIEDRKIAFDELSSIKVVEHKGSKGEWIMLGILGGVGAFALILYASIR